MEKLTTHSKGVIDYQRNPMIMSDLSVSGHKPELKEDMSDE
jgi:hypothetical protein